MGAELYGAQRYGADVRGATFEADFRSAFLESKRDRNGAYLPSAGLHHVIDDGDTEWPDDRQPASSRRSDRPPADQGRPRHQTRHWRVEDVSDGDTVLLGDRPAQLLGVDAPPLDSKRGDDAKRFVRRQLLGRVTVELVRVRSRERRALTGTGSGGCGSSSGGGVGCSIRLRSCAVTPRPSLKGEGTCRGDPPYEGRLLKAEEAARDGGRKIWEGCPRRALRPG